MRIFNEPEFRDLCIIWMHHLVLIVNPMGRIPVRWKFCRKNLEMLCHPICNWLYLFIIILKKQAPVPPEPLHHVCSLTGK